ncbi:MAG: polysaccharide pyruvyl transferase family protein [Paludibacteraceae bacterium]|nr:polysaccharide pyruvyl transferase family protein [Paludibacteraceae bacterium]
MKKYVIIPNCSDLNRGDQALVWETKRLAEDAGFKGDFYVTVEDHEPIIQSEIFGLIPISLVLKHPSRFFKNNDNITYSLFIKVKWGVVAFFDFIYSLLLLCPVLNVLVYPFLPISIRKSIDVLKDADAIFIKGGGFVHFYGGMTSSYYAYFSLYHIFFCASLKKDIYFLPNSMGPYEGFAVKWMVRKALNLCKFVSVRESLSKNMLRSELGIEAPVFPDLALYLPNSRMTKNEIFSRYSIPIDRPLVAITMRPHRFPKSRTPKEDYLNFKKEMSKFVECLYSKGYMPMLVSHTLAINTNENDKICIDEVVKYVNPKHYVLFSDETLNCQELKSVYSICDYIVGTRFHSVIFSFANNVPGLAITYTGNKAQGIMKDFGLDSYSICIDDVTADDLINKFDMLVENKQQILMKIEAYLSAAREKRNTLINTIKR